MKKGNNHYASINMHRKLLTLIEFNNKKLKIKNKIKKEKKRFEKIFKRKCYSISNVFCTTKLQNTLGEKRDTTFRRINKMNKKKKRR